MDVIAIALTERDACTSKHQQVVSMQHKWHRCQFPGHVAICAHLVPYSCSKMIPPKLPEERIVFIIWPSRFIIIWVITSKHIEVGIICHTTMSTSCWWRSVASQKPVRDPYDGTGLNEAPPNWVPSYFLLTCHHNYQQSVRHIQHMANNT